MEDGSVLSSLNFFTIIPGKQTDVEIKIRDIPVNLKSIGKFDFEQIYLTSENKKDFQKLTFFTKGKDVLLILMNLDNQPSKHILNDMTMFVSQFNKWDGVIVFSSELSNISIVDIAKIYSLPKRIFWTVDSQKDLLNAFEINEGSGLESKLPLVALCKNNGEIYYFSSGYKIRIVEQVLNIMINFKMMPTKPYANPSFRTI